MKKSDNTNIDKANMGRIPFENYLDEELRHRLILDFVHSFKTVENCIVQTSANSIKNGLGNIVVFKSPNLFIFNFGEFLNRDYLSLKEKYKRNKISNKDDINFDFDKINLYMLDKDGNRILKKRGEFSMIMLNSVKKAIEKENVYGGFILKHGNQKECYYISYDELDFYIKTPTIVNINLSYEWMKKHSIKFEVAPKNNKWSNEELELIMRLIKDGHTATEVSRNYRKRFSGKNRNSIQLKYYQLKKEMGFKSNDSYVGCLYGTDEIFEDIVEYHKMYKKMRMREKNGWFKEQ